MTRNYVWTLSPAAQAYYDRILHLLDHAREELPGHDYDRLVTEVARILCPQPERVA